MLVSIVIPCFNVADYIEECLNSVWNQHYKNIEIICVENGSTDKTCAILYKLKDTHPELIILNEAPKGAPYARNRGLMESKGDWIQFLDADDLLLPEKIAHQRLLIGNCKEKLDFVVGNCYWQQADGTSVIWHRFAHEPWIDLIKGTFGDTCSNLWNREFLLKINGWDTSAESSQEFVLLYKCLRENGSFIYDEQPYTITRERDAGSISKANVEANTLRFIKFREDVVAFLKEKGLFTDEINQEFNLVIYNKLIQLYYLNKDEAIRLYHHFFRKRSMLFKLKGIKLIEKIVCVLFSIKGVVFIMKIKKIIRGVNN